MGVAAVAAGVITAKLTQDNRDEIPFWDVARDYYMFPIDYTHIIDDIISSSYGEMGQQEIMSEYSRKPGIGEHYFYFNKAEDRGYFERWFRYVKMLRKTKTIGNQIITYYQCLVLPGQNGVLDKLINLIFIADSNSIRVINIDTSGVEPSLFYTTKKYFEPRPYQIIVINHIIDGYNKDPHHNYKIILSGSRGTGKTITAKMVKKALERQNQKIMVKLFSDFDPSATAVNVEKLVLKQAEPNCPVIIVIDEIDIIFEEVNKEKQIFDPRTLHTKNKLTFNAMMDAIANTPYTILIGTTEKSIEYLYTHQEYHSFIRKGRIDDFITVDFDPTKTKLVKHEHIQGYSDKIYVDITQKTKIL